LSNDKSRPTKPAGGTLCLRESQNVAHCTTEAESFHQYYIDSGATSHYINNVDILHDFTNFNKPHEIKTTEARCLWAIGSGTLKFTAVADGLQMEGELHDIYYIPDIETWLISLGDLFSQGWKPNLTQTAYQYTIMMEI